MSNDSFHLNRIATSLFELQHIARRAQKVAEWQALYPVAGELVSHRDKLQAELWPEPPLRIRGRRMEKDV